MVKEREKKEKQTNKEINKQSKAEKTVRDKEHQYQADADQIRKDKDAQIKVINTQLVDAISELRKRPSRTDQANAGQSCNGTRLYSEDAEFLIREAARADELRAELQQCQAQYNELRQALKTGKTP